AILAKESHAGTVDNVCSAMSKLIIVNPNGVPLQQMFPALIQHLPLKVDFLENEAIVRCFFNLYQQGNPVLKEQLENVIKIVVHIYHKKETSNEETENLVKDFLRTINRDFPQEFANIVSTLGEEVT
ncbi:hypothetical protein AMK59_2065, partial [Oryctes borbonicus]